MAGRKSCDAFNDPEKALKQLRKAARHTDGSHKIKAKNGSATLVIGEFHKRHKKFAAALIRALEAGALTTIDVGHIDHPKMLVFLQRLLGKLSRPQTTVIWGYLDPSKL